MCDYSSWSLARMLKLTNHLLQKHGGHTSRLSSTGLSCAPLTVHCPCTCLGLLEISTAETQGSGDCWRLDVVSPQELQQCREMVWRSLQYEFPLQQHLLNFCVNDPASALPVSTHEHIWSMCGICCLSSVKHCRVWHILPGALGISGMDWDRHHVLLEQVLRNVKHKLHHYQTTSHEIVNHLFFFASC